MIQPLEMSLNLPMEIPHGIISDTTKVWQMLSSCKDGNLESIRALVKDCPELLYAQYNYTPPIHLAVREGHLHVVRFLLERGAYDPKYRTYPFLDNLLTIAKDRNYHDIARLLEAYSTPVFSGDNGTIDFKRTPEKQDFEASVDKDDLDKTEAILKQHPEFALDETFFWGEGILMMPAKENNRKMIDLLLAYRAKVPAILKWTQYYYFERYDAASHMMEKGMNPNTMSWHHVSLLHDMAQKGDIAKAELLLSYGASINAIEEEYQSTPLGLASRWGQTEMVSFLLSKGADPDASGAAWAKPQSWAEKKEFQDIEEILKKAHSGS